MIEQVEEVSAKLEVFRFTEPEVLEDRKIDIVDGWQQERIPANVRLSSGTRLNVTSIRIIGKISNYSSNYISVLVKGTGGYSTQRNYLTADSLRSAGVKDRAISGVVPVSIGIVSAAYCYPLASFIGIGSGDVKAAQQQLSKTGPVRKPRQFVNRRSHKPMPVIERGRSPFSAYVLKILYPAR